MNLTDIQIHCDDLNHQLKQTLSTMEFSTQLITIRDEIKKLQDICPHKNENYDFSQTHRCPYCGKHF